MHVCTYSIVARDAATCDLGIAVESRFLAVGAVVPYGRAGVGAVALQSFLDPGYAPALLGRMAAGEGAADALRSVVATDPASGARQIGVVDGRGGAASFTGPDCLGWAGDRQGAGYAVQGNMLSGDGVVDAMAAAYEGAAGDLAERLVTALEAGLGAGGDARGKQAAALLVLREGAGFLKVSDRYIDVRVDDHPEPVAELRRLLELARTANLLWVEAATQTAEGDWEGAVGTLQRAREREPDDINVVYFLAKNLYAAGRHEEAETLIRPLYKRHAGLRGFMARDPVLGELARRLEAGVSH